MAAHPTHVLGLSGSLRPGSNTAHAVDLALSGAAEAGVIVERLDLGALDLPFCGMPDAGDRAGTRRLRQAVSQAHGLIIGTPEYHGSCSGVIKNALDLLGFDECQGKLVGLVGTAGGDLAAVSALQELRNISRSLHMWVVPSQAGVPRSRSAFTPTGELNDARLVARLRGVGREVAHFATLHHDRDWRRFLVAWEKSVANPGGQHD